VGHAGKAGRAAALCQVGEPAPGHLVGGLEDIGAAQREAQPVGHQARHALQQVAVGAREAPRPEEDDRSPGAEGIHEGGAHLVRVPVRLQHLR
jgi:hypothetical protein